MLLHSQKIRLILLLTALVFSTSARAGLYGFSQVDETRTVPHTEELPRHIQNYRKDMRELVVSLADYGKSRNKGFQVLIHEGQYLFDKSLWEYHRRGYNEIRQSKTLVDDFSFLNKELSGDDDKIKEISQFGSLIDGVVINNHYCQNAPVNDLIKDLNISVFSIEHCNSDEALDKAIAESFRDNIAIYPFIHIEEAFRNIAQQLIINESAEGILSAQKARNINFLIDDEKFSTPYQMIDDIRNSNYDIIVIHPVFHQKKPFTKEEVDMMKFKKNGARRLILAQYNVSEISELDYLWHKNWYKNRPTWIVDASFTTPNAYLVKYWTPEWHKLSALYFRSIVDTAYDGVFLTGLENHAYFEFNKPLE